ncbi:hypothetical protein HYE68_000208 [Fusarium pseudograminearum]|nr:hypothetical protein HYE68_000208 [Fusarium pseudograminearum]
MSSKGYDRWLKDAESWAQEDDWNPEQYLKWVNALNLLAKSKEMIEKHRQTLLANRPKGDYDIPDKALVKRVQSHMMTLDMPVLDSDVAEMLQYAADGTPIGQAVEKHLRDYMQKIRESEAVAGAYNAHALGHDTCRVVKKLQQTRVDGGLVDRSKFGQVFAEINEWRVEDEQKSWPEAKLKHLEDTFSDDTKMELFMKRCAEPLVRNNAGDNHAATALEVLIDAGDLKTLIDLAVTEEEKHCSWNATAGPTLKALKSLGRAAVGQKLDKLAECAKGQQRPVAV